MEFLCHDIFTTWQKILLLMLVVVSSQSDTQECGIKHTERDVSCSTDGACPTWYICDEQKQCKCGGDHSNRVVCDDENLCSAELNCNCVTYDDKTNSTFVGSYYYNCHFAEWQRKNDHQATRKSRNANQWISLHSISQNRSTVW